MIVPGFLHLGSGASLAQKVSASTVKGAMSKSARKSGCLSQEARRYLALVFREVFDVFFRFIRVWSGGLTTYVVDARMVCSPTLLALSTKVIPLIAFAFTNCYE